MPLRELVPGLYEIGISPSRAMVSGSPPNTVYSYFLTRQEVSPSLQPTLEDVWYRDDLVGWFIFLAAPILDSQDFVQDARPKLPSLATQQQNPRAIVWLQGPEALASYESLVFFQLNVSPDIRAPANPTATVFQWPPLTLTIQSDSPPRIGFDFEALAFLITGDTSSSGTVSLDYGGDPYFYDQASQFTWNISIPIVGAGAGAFSMKLGLEFSGLVKTFACAFRFFLARQERISTLQYPFYPPGAPGDGILAFAIHLHPLFQTDPAWTAFTLDLGETSPSRNSWQSNSGALRASYFRTTSGGCITLAPFPVTSGSREEGALVPPGFAFCKAPGSSSPPLSPPSALLYLAPIGTYQVTQISSVAGSPQPAGSSEHWMCGLTGQEYIELTTGELVAFEPSKPAFASEPGHGGTGAAAALDDTFTTAWLRIPATEAHGGHRYFGQPSASVYYSTAAPGQFGVPVAALLSVLTSPISFPLVPYGGIFSDPRFNTSISASDFNSFESLRLTKERHAKATAQSGGPVFLPSTVPIRALAAPRLAEEPPGTAVTPQGFLVQLNGEEQSRGTWNTIELARSPQDPEQFLSFHGTGSPPVVSSELATVLLQDELFLVVSDATLLGGFSNELSVAGFNFTLDVGTPSDGQVGSNTTILIFKFNTSTSLKEFAERPELWAEQRSFVRDLKGTQHQLRLVIEEAERGASPEAPGEGLAPRLVRGGGPSGTDPFVHFRQLMASPEWTGVLALNCAIDGNGMPPDLQMLLGGINGQLRAHHFGIQSNRLTYVSDATASINQSSLFGVIAYPSREHPMPPLDTRDDFDFEIEKLQVVFQNSKITQFNVLAGLTINRLFGRQVELVSEGPTPASPHNTLRIPGQYQVQDGVGTVKFSSSQPFVYRFPVPDKTTRVLEQILFDSATLVPVSADTSGSPSGTSPGGTQVRSRFGLGGALWFNPSPFSNAPGLDLFSYGNPGSPAGGLAFSDLTVNISFTLDERGEAEPGSKRVVADMSRLTPASTMGAIRPGSLLYSLPLQLSKFLYSEKGFSTASLGASPVHVLQLEGATPAPVLSPVPSPLLPATSAPSPNVTAMPQFGLEFDLPLGTLGALSSVHVGLMAKLIIGWGASRVIPDTDAAAVLVQLPQIFAGYGGLELQGILKTTFGDANLLKVDLETGPVYALLFNNIQLSVLGFGFPPGVVIDFLIFAGQPENGAATNTSNIAWFLGAYQPSSSPERA